MNKRHHTCNYCFRERFSHAYTLILISLRQVKSSFIKVTRLSVTAIVRRRQHPNFKMQRYTIHREKIKSSLPVNKETQYVIILHTVVKNEHEHSGRGRTVPARGTFFKTMVITSSDLNRITDAMQCTLLNEAFVWSLLSTSYFHMLY